MAGVRTPHRGLTEVPGGLRGGAGRPGVRFQGGETQPPPPTAHACRSRGSPSFLYEDVIVTWQGVRDGVRGLS